MTQQVPQVGDVWEKDGKMRKVTRMDFPFGSSTKWFGLWWNGRKKSTWCTTWYRWARGAKLVERDGKAVGKHGK